MTSSWQRLAAPRPATDGLAPVVPIFEGKKMLYKTSLKSVLHKLKNSPLNRTVDNVRAAELKGFMQRERYIPNVIYATQQAVPDGKLHIYDGGHRYAAACQLLRESKLDLDVLLAARTLTPDEDPEAVVKAEMHAINRRVRVPPQYTDPEAKQALKDLARDLTIHILGNWPAIRSVADRPQVPNVNEHRLEEELYQRLHDMATAEEDPVTDQQLQLLAQHKDGWLRDINDSFKSQLGPNPTGHAQRAAKKGCWLFAVSPGPMDQFLDAVEARTRAAR